MSDNPYQAPMSEATSIPAVVGVNSGKREDLRKIAMYQKGIMICILVNITMLICAFALPEGTHWVAIGGLIIGAIASTVFVFLLATNVYSTGTGILMGIL